MEKISRRGIAYDLTVSPYVYEKDGFKFHFSSPYTMKKFTGEVEFYKERIEEGTWNRYGFTSNLQSLAYWILYDRMEKRGWYVTYHGEKVERWQIVLDGAIRIDKTLRKPSGLLTAR